MRKKELVNFFGKQITFSELFVITMAVNVVIGFGLPLITTSFAGVAAFITIISAIMWVGENFGRETMGKVGNIFAAILLIVVLSIYFSFFNRDASNLVIFTYFLLFGFAAYINVMYHKNDKQVNSD